MRRPSPGCCSPRRAWSWRSRRGRSRLRPAATGTATRTGRASDRPRKGAASATRVPPFPHSSLTELPGRLPSGQTFPVTDGRRWPGPVAGVVAAAAALGVAELVAVFAGPRSAPLVAVGGVVVDSVPGPVKNFAVATFGTHDKTALLVGTTVVLTVFAAVIGALAVRWPAAGLAGIGVFGVIGMAAALTRADAGPLSVLPALLGAAAGAVVLRVLLRPRE